VGTTKGLAVYRRQRDDFQPVSPVIAATGKLADSTINTLLQDSQHRVWFGTPRGLFRLQAANAKRCERLVDLTMKHRDLSHQTIRTLYEDHDRTVWVGTSAGLAKLKPTPSGQFELTNYFLHPTDSVYHNISNGINTIAEDRAGRLWIGTERNGIALFDKQQGRVVSWSLAPGLDLSI
jgi:sugar lactone lactonase YvrE